MKNVISLLLAAVLVISLAGCSSSSSSEESQSSTSSSSSTGSQSSNSSSSSTGSQSSSSSSSSTGSQSSSSSSPSEDESQSSGSVSTGSSASESGGDTSGSGQVSESNPPEEQGQAATPISLGGSITTSDFTMTFNSMEIVPEYSFQQTELSSIEAFVEEGCQLLLVKGHIENTGTTKITTSAFYVEATVNDTYNLDNVTMDFEHNIYTDLDPLSDVDFSMRVNIPNKMVDIFEKGTFTIAFNNDISTHPYSTEADNLYSLSNV